MPEIEYPLPAFHFSVRIGTETKDTSFLEVEGIGSTLQTQTAEEGGENRFLRRLPKSVSNTPLILKRSIGGLDSPLAKWCQSIFDLGFARPMIPKPITVNLLDEQGSPVRSWLFSGALPVEWSVNSFAAMKNEVAIEQIKLQYNYQQRMM